MKEMNFIEAVNFKKENPNINVYRIDRANRKSHMIITSEDQIIYGSCDITIIQDVEATWTAEQPQRTHREIMNNWFKLKGWGWRKIIAFNIDHYLFCDGWHTSKFFNDLEMKTQEEMENWGIKWKL